jgi:hypothetical protein
MCRLNCHCHTATGRAGEGSDIMSKPKGVPSIKAATDAIKGALSK